MRLGFAALALISSLEAMAAHEVVQTIRTELDGKRLDSVHQWLTDGRRFRLSVKNGDSETLYVFNGRNLYICGALGSEQVAFLKRHHVDDASLLDKLRKGACQVVPSNFMARFFIAPSEAVESIDRSDGLRLTLGFEDYRIQGGNKRRKVQGQSCEDLERQYTLVKSDDSSALSLKLSARETLCQAKDLKWRDALWREVSKAALRQPGGQPFLARLQDDMGSLSGLPLTSRSEFRHQAGQKVLQGKRTLETKSIRQTTAGDRDFAIPKGFEIFNPEGIKLAEKGASDKGKGKAPPKDPLKGLFQNATSIFFCAISGALGCFSD